MSEMKLILIKSPVIAAMYSGEDVYIVPYDPADGEPYLSRMYRGDDWSICNDGIVGYHGEACYIAIESDKNLGLI